MRLFDPFAQSTFSQSHLLGYLAYRFARLLNNIDRFGFLLVSKETAWFFRHLNSLLHERLIGNVHFFGGMSLLLSITSAGYA